MAEFNYRKGTVRIPKKYTVKLTNEEGELMYERTMVSGIIKNMPHFVSSLIDGAVMFDCYEDGLGDLDMVKEVNGHFLNIEFKGGLHKLLKNGGQLQLAVNMAKTSKFTTLFVEGNSDNPKRVFSVSHVQAFNDYQIRELSGVEGLNEMIKTWATYAGRQANVGTRDELTTLKEQLAQQLRGGK